MTKCHFKRPLAVLPTGKMAARQKLAAYIRDGWDFGKCREAQENRRRVLSENKKRHFFKNKSVQTFYKLSFHFLPESTLHHLAAS